MILLLDAMAKHLGYKDLNWSTIKKSYLPRGISEDMEDDAEYEFLQLEVMRFISEFIRMHENNLSKALQSIKDCIHADKN